MGFQEIEITICKKTGEMIAETFGFKGKECEEVLDEVQEKIGGETIQKRDKADKFEHATETEQEKQKQKQKQQRY